MPPFPDLHGLSPEERETILRQHGIAVDLWKVQIATLTELGKAAGETARLAAGQVLLVNVGAAGALLALIGNLAGRGSPTLGPVLPSLGLALLAYAGGATLAVLVSGSAVLSHHAALAARPVASGRWGAAAKILFGLSLAAFGTGTGIAAVALLEMRS